jgi:CRP-like cAMP-binding protein
MISPEQLRRYRFFSFLTPAEQREMAMITDEVAVAEGEVLFHTGDEAEALYVLVDGSMELQYVVIDEHEPELRKQFLVGTINPGDVLGISAVIAPHKLTATAIADVDSTVLRIDAGKLRALEAGDLQLAVGLYRQVAQVAMERLHTTRILLSGASTPV